MQTRTQTQPAPLALSQNGHASNGASLPATRTPDATAIERVLMEGDLSPLTVDQRVSYYNETCKSLGLNPLTKPFAYIKLNGKLLLYALKDCTEQLRKIHGVQVTALIPSQVGDVYVVTASGQDRTGRCDAATGAVPIAKLTGDNLANAMMKAETKAKRRLTLSICGLGMLDETELETIDRKIMQTETVTQGPQRASQSVPPPDHAPPVQTFTPPPDPVPPPAETIPDEPAAEEQATDKWHKISIKSVRTEDFTSKNKKQIRRYIVGCDGKSGGVELKTIDREIGKKAQEAFKEGQSVWIQFEDTQYGYNLTGLEIASERE